MDPHEKPARFTVQNILSGRSVNRHGTSWVHVPGTSQVPLPCPEPGNRNRPAGHTSVTLWMSPRATTNNFVEQTADV